MLSTVPTRIQPILLDDGDQILTQLAYQLNLSDAQSIYQSFESSSSQSQINSVEDVPISDILAKLAKDLKHPERYHGCFSPLETVAVFPGGTTTEEILKKCSETYLHHDEPVMVIDLSIVFAKYQQWQRLLPNVTPHYAVKSNDDPILVKFLSALGANFDCATLKEIKQANSLPGVQPENIIFGNPCKMKSHVLYAKQSNVKQMTFDCVEELEKVAELFPTAELFLRIRVDDSQALCQLSTKFGANLQDCPAILERSIELGVKVVGLSFHVGSGQQSMDAYEDALLRSRAVFDMASKIGIELHTLDIGGGFPGDDDLETNFNFERLASSLNQKLEEYFPGVNIVSEPGRYFAASCCTLLTKVTSKKKCGNKFAYYINDGVYSSFNNILCDHAVVKPELFEEKEGMECFETTIFGPTCDGLDTIVRDVPLPELERDDFIFWSNMGAYTICANSTFNGCPLPKHIYVWRGGL